MNLITDDDVRDARKRLLARGEELRERLGRRDAVEQSTSSELERIDHALRRMDAGGFALCERCGHEISVERLRVVPHATRCHDCEHEARLG